MGPVGGAVESYPVCKNSSCSGPGVCEAASQVAEVSTTTFKSSGGGCGPELKMPPPPLAAPTGHSDNSEDSEFVLKPGMPSDPEIYVKALLGNAIESADYDVDHNDDMATSSSPPDAVSRLSEETAPASRIPND